MATGSIVQLYGLNPTTNVKSKTIIPWTVAIVAPPKVLPNMISNRVTGATKVSFKNPNCLSQMSSIPENMAVKRIAWAITPGAKKLM
jgi:hypothetical protein